ncbi:MAG: SpoIIE family protein phosphatase [Thiogranum sp.]
MNSVVVPVVEGLAGTRGRVLLVDPCAGNRLMLKSLLLEMDFDVVPAENIEQAVQCFRETVPDMIFIDIVTPVLDGFEVAKRIKSLAGGDSVPITFITAPDDNAVITRCIDFGADVFPGGSPNVALLQAKIVSMERFRALHLEIAVLNREIQFEAEIAEKVFSRAVTSGNADISHFYSLLRPASTFNGDMLLTAFSPARDIHVLLADFTGHGLAAALGALPASEVFHAMVGKGFSVDEIMDGINRKLCRLLPTGIFMAAQYVCISHDLKHVTVCNCGMPDVLLLDDAGRHIVSRLASSGMPLGIVPDVNFRAILEHCAIRSGNRVVLYSDGLVEAGNAEQEMFGDERFQRALCKWRDTPLDRVITELDAFCGQEPQADDISLVEIPCIAENLPPWDMSGLLQGDEPEISVSDSADGGLEIRLLFEGICLRNIDPVPVLINHVETSLGKGLPSQPLFTILTELYVNALDHGVLGLESGMKNNSEGFAAYFGEREQRLAALERGFVRIEIRGKRNAQGGCVTIQVEDSGKGFDYQARQLQSVDEDALGGRGIRLLRQLCDSLTYTGVGNQVEAVFRWDESADS